MLTVTVIGRAVGSVFQVELLADGAEEFLTETFR
jgi:hypothetical protein